MMTMDRYPHHLGDIRRPDPEVAGRGTDDRVLARPDLAGQLALRQGGVGGAHLVAAGREVLAEQDDDVRRDAG
ncbi:MAG: hypothetical protein ACHQDE_10195, partial [Acidimicrobiia bacterium]